MGEEESVMIPAETADADVEGNTANQDQTDEKSAKKAEKKPLVVNPKNAERKQPDSLCCGC